MKRKEKQWIYPRHTTIRKIAWPIFRHVVHLRYDVELQPFREPDRSQYLILLNHQTPFDQFFVDMVFPAPVYYVATEDIFSLGWISSVIRYLVAPIPIKKQTNDLKAVVNCIRVAREGGTIAMAPEGNRTYSGRTEYMKSSVSKLAKKLGLPIALFRIEGGYGAEPRWSDVIRKGKMKAYVSEVIAPEEAAAMTDDELFARIEAGLAVNEACESGLYRHKRRAEYLERCVYVCPFCGLSEFESHGHVVTCKHCGKQVVYEEDKKLTGIDCDFPFPYVAQWYDYQNRFINDLNVLDHVEFPLYEENIRLSEVLLYRKKVLLRKHCQVRLYGDRIVIDEGSGMELTLPFSEITAAACLGKNKLNIYHGDHVYQFKGSKRFNALKYVNLYFRHKNLTQGDPYGKFLGL